jgi:YgiT-type zinc finger domain-containing protein
MCNACFEKKAETITTFTVEKENRVIVIRNVPCLECPVCGETFFTDEVASRIEVLINNDDRQEVVTVINFM